MNDPTNRPETPSSASDRDRQDQVHLISLNQKLQVLRDRTASVAKGYHSGCIVTGRGGIGKSFAIVEELERLGAFYRLTNSHVTPRGLFDLLAGNPDAVHLIEDAEEITQHRLSLGVLRSALWGSRRDRNDRPERQITWDTHRQSLEVIFSGGIILVANRRLSDIPEVQALATRVPCLDIIVNDREIAALMRHVAAKGYRRGEITLVPAECLEVADFIISESARLNRSLDMRLLINAFSDRLQADDHETGCGWQDLVYSTLCGRPSVVGDVEAAGIRAIRKSEEMEIAAGLVGLEPQEQLAVWKQKTGKSRATLYRRLGKLGRIDSQGFES